MEGSLGERPTLGSFGVFSKKGERRESKSRRWSSSQGLGGFQESTWVEVKLQHDFVMYKPVFACSLCIEAFLGYLIKFLCLGVE